MNILRITVGVFLGNIATIIVLVSLSPYITVERRIISSFFN